MIAGYRFSISLSVTMKIKLCGKTAIFVSLFLAISHCVSHCPVDSVFGISHGVSRLSQILHFGRKIEHSLSNEGLYFIIPYYVIVD